MPHKVFKMEFTPHAKVRTEEREITEEEVITAIRSPQKRLKESGSKRTIFVRDGLFVVVEGNKVITVWRSRDWEKTR